MTGFHAGIEVISIKKAQSWSIDIVLGLVVFMMAFLLFYSSIGPNKASKSGDLKDSATYLVESVSSGSGVVKNNEVDEQKLNELKNLTYDNLTQMFRVQGDFCIYLEDDEGNIILINNSYQGIGASSINLSGVPCGKK